MKAIVRHEDDVDVPSLLTALRKHGVVTGRVKRTVLMNLSEAYFDAVRGIPGVTGVGKHQTTYDMRL